MLQSDQPDEFDPTFPANRRVVFIRAWMVLSLALSITSNA